LGNFEAWRCWRTVSNHGLPETVKALLRGVVTQHAAPRAIWSDAHCSSNDRGQIDGLVSLLKYAHSLESVPPRVLRNDSGAPPWQHPFGPTPPWQIPRGGLAVVARAHKCSRRNVSILFFLNLAAANLYKHFWCYSL
jgi:hypothetical protein